MLIDIIREVLRGCHDAKVGNGLVRVAGVWLAVLYAILDPRQSMGVDMPAVSETLTIAELTELGEHRSPAVIEVTYLTTQDVQGRPPQAPLVDKAENHILIDLKNLRFAFDSNSFLNAKGKEPQIWDPKGEREVTTWDLESYMVYRVNTKTGLIANKALNGKPIPALDPYIASCAFYPPKQDGRGVNDGSLVSFLLHASVRSGTEEIDGRHCHVIECGPADAPNARLWLDVERSAMPIKVQLFNRGAVQFESRLEDLSELTGGGQTVWLPMRVVITTLVSSGGTITRVIKVDKNGTKINPTVSDGSFRIDFPSNTLVVDKVGGKRFFVGTQKRQVATEIRSGFRWGIWANVMIISALGILVFRRWRRRIAATGAL
jgi:hypothetical protein